MNRIMYILLIVLLCTSNIKSHAQCNEYGIVLEYRGVQKKTPLSGVELSIIGAQSTVSKVNGTFILKFTTSKPGEAVRYNDIYKSGYVIFNKDAVSSWRISNSKRLFNVIMCKETDFRELKKKFYGIIEKSYKEDYLQQKTIAQKRYKDVMVLKQELARLEDEYQKKLSNINTYVEIFSRIDRSEMDENEQKAIQYIEEGKITKAIEEYEKLKIIQKADEQINKLKSANKIIQAGKQMENEAVEDLLSLSKKLQQQIAAYEVGGFRYDDSRIASIKKIINVYHQINTVGKYNYHEEEGKWLIILAQMEWNEAAKKERLKCAAQIPSFCGLTAYADYCYYHTPYASHYAIDAQKSLKMAIRLAKSNGIKQEIQDSLLAISQTLPDFCEPIENGDTICFSIVDSLNNQVNIVPRTNFAYNVLSETASIPSEIYHEGKKYKINAVVRHALDNNRNLRKLILQNELEGNINGCDLLDTLIINKTIHLQEKKTTNNIKKTYIVRTDSLNVNKMLRYYIDLVQLISRDTYSKYQNATLWPDYEELMSIGILTLQVLIKNKTPEELQKYNTAYLITAIKWGIEHEMSIRYKWFGEIYPSLENVSERNQSDPQLHSTNVRTAVYRNIYRIYRMLDDKENNLTIYLNENVYKDIMQGGVSIVKAMEKMTTTDRLILKEALTSNLQIENILRKHHITLEKYNLILDYLKLFMQNSKAVEIVNNENTVIVYTIPEVDNTTSKNQKQFGIKFLPIAKLAAQITHQEVDKQKIDYEELLSIGIQAITVMSNNKTSDELANYTDWYILTALRWAMKNELRIRYKISDNKTELDETSKNKDFEHLKIRIAVYSSIWKARNLIPMMEKDDRTRLNELLKIGQTIANCVNQLSMKTEKEILISLLNGASITEISKNVGLTQSAVYNKVKKNLDTFKKNIEAVGFQGA